MRSSLSALILPTLAVLLAGGGLLASSQQRVERQKQQYDVLAAPPLSGMKDVFINILSLGHKNLYDDFINLWLLQSLVDPRKGSDGEAMMRQIRSVIQHKPPFETLYMLSCFVMMDDYKKPELCREIIMVGLEVFPRSWRLPMTQAFVEWFKLKQPAQAASFFAMAATRDNSPEYVKKVAHKLVETNELSDADIASGLEILARSESNPQFAKLLQTMAEDKNRRALAPAKPGQGASDVQASPDPAAGDVPESAPQEPVPESASEIEPIATPNAGP